MRRYFVGDILKIPQEEIRSVRLKDPFLRKSFHRQKQGILDVKIGDLPEDFDRDSFNVVVIQECTPVVYDEAGNPVADWTTVYTDYGEEAGRNG